MTRSRRQMLAAGLAPALLLLTGCGGSATAPGSPPSTTSQASSSTTPTETSTSSTSTDTTSEVATVTKTATVTVTSAAAPSDDTTTALDLPSPTSRTTTRETSPDPLQGWTAHDYQERIGDLALSLRHFHEDAGKGMDMAAGTDLNGLSMFMGNIAELPAPPSIDRAWWYGQTTTLESFAEKASDAWLNEDYTDANAKVAVITTQLNILIVKVNSALHLHMSKVPG